jgi:hypothetical protein
VPQGILASTRPTLAISANDVTKMSSAASLKTTTSDRAWSTECLICSSCSWAPSTQNSNLMEAHLALPVLLQAGAQPVSQPPTPGAEPLSVMTDCAPSSNEKRIIL